VHSPGWKLLERRAGGPPRTLEQSTTAFYLRARYHLWWRRWRQFGV
jgi:hypothetical protein